MGSVNGKVALITGGANGIGAEVARRLHEKGAKLVLTDLDEVLLKEVATRLGEDRVVTATADVRDLAAMQAATTKGIERFGGIDIVIANAGISTSGSVLAVDPQAFKTLIDVNVVGVFNTVRAALPSVIERRGYVLIVSSAAAYAPAAGMVPYDTSKAGVEHFANALRLEVAHRGVDVGSAHMLWIDTPLVREGKADSEAMREMLRRLPGPLGKTTSVEKCGEAFLKGIENRKRQINCPSFVGLMRWLKPLLSRGRRVDVAEIGSRTVAENGRRSRGARPVDERSHRSAGKELMRRIGVLVALLALLAACSTNRDEEPTSSAPPPSAAAVTPEQARAIAKEAYIYGFPIVDNYRVMYSYFVDKDNPEYKGGWNEVHSTARLYTPEDKAIQTPNSDTPYSASAPTCAPNRWS